MPVSTHQSRGKQVRASVTGIDPVAADIRLVRLRPETPLRWLAGQYVNISFGGLAPRAYSIASAPGDDLLEIHIKRGKGEASQYVLDSLAEGEQVLLSAPEGLNVFDDSIDCPILALAGGLGIAPLKAIAETALKGGFTHPFTLYWGTTDPGERYIESVFRALAGTYANFTFIPVDGRHVTDVISQDFDDLGAYHVYISGPPAMIAAAVPLLRDKKADPAKISYDRHPEAANVTP